MRSCIHAHTLRSANTVYATMVSITPDHAGDLDEMDEEQRDHAFAPTVARRRFSVDAAGGAPASNFSSTP